MFRRQLAIWTKMAGDRSKKEVPMLKGNLTINAFLTQFHQGSPKVTYTRNNGPFSEFCLQSFLM